MNVYVDGVFDLFHEGHVNFLRQASTYGNLIAGVHSDAYVQSYKRKPVIHENTRYEVVRACKYVSEVITGVEVLTDEMIDKYQIGMVLHGDDFSAEECLKHYKAAIDRNIFRTVAYSKGVSSTAIIAMIEERFSS